MKKTRILAMVLALVLLVSLLPMSALAMTLYVDAPVFEKNSATLADPLVDFKEYETKEVTDKKVVVKAEDYDNLITDADGKLYEIVGMHVMNSKIWDKLDKTPICNNVTSVTIEPMPVYEDYKTDEEFNAAFEKWYETNGAQVLVAYGPHTHDCTEWISDNTNHWKICLECDQWFIQNNWHYDGDKDDKCDVCGFSIVYYDIAVAEFEGATIEIEGDREDGTAAYNDKITVTVEAEDGYVVKDVRFYKVQKDGIKYPIMYTAVEAGHIYDCVIQNYDTEIVVITEKK